MPDFSQRSYQAEIMDDLEAGGEDLLQALRELETINTWLGGHDLTIKGLNKIIAKHPQKKDWVIVDAGCGRGDSLLHIAKWCRAEKLKIQLIGIDANSHIIEEAEKHCRAWPEISFIVLDVFSAEMAKLKADITCCTLFTHHFTKDQLIQLYKQFHQISEIAFLINDLQRHPLAYYSINLLTSLFSKSKMVKNDARLSVLRSFHKNELQELMEKAAIKKFSIKWKWAFRWEVIAWSNGSIDDPQLKSF
ncbi:methyltransferase domain-containing protein [Fulvivirgaceae bacterium LMO-SS25]